MQCPTCGYVMDPLDTACKRCARLGTAATATSAPPPPTMPAPPTMPEPTLPPPKPTMVRRPREPIAEPELGWVLTIILWVLIVLHSLALLLVVGGAAVFGAAEDFSGTLVFALLSFGVRLAALIAMLRCQRWGFYLFCVFAIFPAGIRLMSGNVNPVLLMVDTVPALLILVLVIAKWDLFE